MKAQVTLEFIGTFILFLLAVVGILALTVDELPQFNNYAETAEKNLEAKTTTDLLLTSPGVDGDGNFDWEENPSNVETPGLASENMVVSRDKLDSLQTMGDENYNYTSFVNDLGLDYDYNFEFKWFPIVETHRNFIRNSPPNNPNIREPNTDFYNQSDNRVHYGEIKLQDQDIRFLVTAYSGAYNTTYVVNGDWDFSDADPYGEGDTPVALQESEEVDQNFTIENIQNREDKPGASLVLGSDLGEFGRNRQASQGNIEKLNRYPLLEDGGDSDVEIMRMEVLVW